MTEHICELTPIDSETWETTIGVDLVRCRDCKHFAVDQSDHEYRSGWWCKWWNTDIARPDTFCAWGRRADG